MINSLLHRAKNICSNQDQLKEELIYVERALTKCKYPSWAIQRMKLKKNTWYSFPWELECDEEYIGETSRTFGERYKEHLKAPSPIHDHSNISGHTTSLDNFSIVGREEQNLSRLIKESMFIRVNGPSLNKNIGKYHLPHLWDEVLNNSRELKLK